MLIKRIEGSTHVLGESQGYLGLPIRLVTVQCKMTDGDVQTRRGMETAWEPTPDELAALNAGAPIILRLLGTSHPPVHVYVGDPPKDEG